jgi:hypothetical protein
MARMEAEKKYPEVKTVHFENIPEKLSRDTNRSREN